MFGFVLSLLTSFMISRCLLSYISLLLNIPTSLYSPFPDTSCISTLFASSSKLSLILLYFICDNTSTYTLNVAFVTLIRGLTLTPCALNIPTNSHRSPGLTISTISSYTHRYTHPGTSPSGISSGNSCTLTYCLSLNALKL